MVNYQFLHQMKSYRKCFCQCICTRVQVHTELRGRAFKCVGEKLGRDVLYKHCRL